MRKAVEDIQDSMYFIDSGKRIRSFVKRPLSWFWGKVQEGVIQMSCKENKVCLVSSRAQAKVRLCPLEAR
jgi:hypothetical protein